MNSFVDRLVLLLLKLDIWIERTFKRLRLPLPSTGPNNLGDLLFFTLFMIVLAGLGTGLYLLALWLMFLGGKGAC